ncbi:hypothetical protein [Arthrobacter sp. SX1312]|uniref:hypothetical protein n=1 Tax=Arthrobacter sp. SX1312 TaxID=2058896 RepID=UPI001CA5D67C|nr:hypothetical protein [Arthrobacter sp. SX1312]
MEEDIPSPPRLMSFDLSRTVGNEIGIAVDLTIETSDGPQEVTFWMSQEDGQLIGMWLATSPPR